MEDGKGEEEAILEGCQGICGQHHVFRCDDVKKNCLKDLSWLPGLAAGSTRHIKMP